MPVPGRVVPTRGDGYGGITPKFCCERASALNASPARAPLRGRKPAPLPGSSNATLASRWTYAEEPSLARAATYIGTTVWQTNGRWRHSSYSGDASNSDRCASHQKYTSPAK